jgi:hypothetical protein
VIANEAMPPVMALLFLASFVRSAFGFGEALIAAFFHVLAATLIVQALA